MSRGCFKKVLSLLLSVNLFLLIFFNSAAVSFAQTRSQENIIFEKVKSGIVTIESAGFGSGFLVSDKGLILTNYHVVKDQEDFLRVRFDSGAVVKAEIMVTDPENDLAIIRLNLKALKHRPYIFTISENDDTYVGERAISIGSPIDYMVFDKTLTQGVVSKINSKIIYHDIAINRGNSGSPLIGLDGNVIGVNTFIRADAGQALAGAISINKSLKLIQDAEKKATKTLPPKAEVFPDVPSVPYTHKLMNTTLKTEKDVNHLFLKTLPYKIKGKSYDIFIYTPLKEYMSAIDSDSELKKEVRKYVRNKDENKEFDPVGDYNQAVVDVFVIPNPDLTNGSRALMTPLAIISAVTLPFAMIPYYNVKFKKDFKSASLKVKNKELLSFSEGKILIDNETLANNYGPYKYTIVPQKPFYGAFRYDYKYFDTDEEVYFEVKSKDSEYVEKIVIPNYIKDGIRKDFEPYTDYLKNKPNL